MVLLLFLIIFALEICKVQPLSHYSMRFIYIVISFFALMLAFACSRNAVSKENVDIHDTIYSKYFPDDYVSGIRVYRNDMANEENGNVYYCLLNKDTLTVIADLHPSKFSLGGPYNVQKDEVLRKKFSELKDSVKIYQDRTDFGDEGDGPPYFFSAVIGNDTINYIADLSKTNCYAFYDAFLGSDRFSYDDYRVGMNLNDCSIAALIPKEILEKVHRIKLLHSGDYKLPTQKSIGNSIFQIVVVTVDNAIIKNIYVSGY